MCLSLWPTVTLLIAMCSGLRASRSLRLSYSRPTVKTPMSQSISNDTGTLYCAITRRLCNRVRQGKTCTKVKPPPGGAGASIQGRCAGGQGAAHEWVVAPDATARRDTDQMRRSAHSLLRRLARNCEGEAH